MNPNVVAAVVPTRGDVDTSGVRASLEEIFGQVVFYDNSLEAVDFKVYGRYAAIDKVTKPYIYTQDDDCITPALHIVEAADPHSPLTVNVPPGEHPWLAWGAVFPRAVPGAIFKDYLSEHPFDDFFMLWADIVFAEKCDWQRVDLGHRDLPWATEGDRMFLKPDHYVDQEAMRQRCRSLSSSQHSEGIL